MLPVLASDSGQPYAGEWMKCKKRLLFDFRLQRIECALMRNGLLRMRANEKPPTENTRSPSIRSTEIRATNSVLTAANLLIGCIILLPPEIVFL